MKSLFKNLIFLTTFAILPEISFSQIMYPGTPELVGSEEDFWVWATDSCKYTMTPDGSLRAYRDSNDKIIVHLAHYDNYRLTGTSFDNLTSDCNIILSSNWDTDPSNHDNQHWLGGGYTEDGINVHALVHNENWSKANDAASGDYYSTSIVYYSSSDGGVTWTRPTDYVVYSESDNTSGYSDFNEIGHVGVEAKSNIIKHDGYYYTLLETNQIEINNGRTAQFLTYIIRTNNLSDPNSWRGWDGSGYNVELGDRYNETINTNSLAHLNKGSVWEGNVAYHNENLLYSNYFEKFMIVGFGQFGNKNGVYYTLSDDLIHWSQRILVKTWDSDDYIIGETDTRERTNNQYRVSYAGVIDHNSSDRNFGTVGEEAYLYWTENQPNAGAPTCPNGLSCGAYDRKIKRQKIKFTKREVSQFIVDGSGDLEDNYQGDGIANTTSNKTSLRSALLENRYRPPWATNEVLTIKFDLPDNKKTLTPASLFLEPEFPFILDGTSESGYSGNTNDFGDGLNHNPIVKIDGEFAIINLKAGNSEIRGMDIFSVTAQGNSNKITNSIIQNLTVEGENNTIGIKDSGPNLIHKNIVIKGDNNIVQGNYIGTNKSGDSPQNVVSHSDPIIGIQSSNNTIDNNLVALLGTSHNGIQLEGTASKNNIIKNNFISVTPNGSTAFSSMGADGIKLNGSNVTGNTIENNIIGNNETGISLNDANNNEIYNNRIGIGSNNENINVGTGIWVTGSSSGNKIGSEAKPNNIQNNTTGLSFLNSSAENDANANVIYGNSTNIFNNNALDFTFHSAGINSTEDSIHFYFDSISSAVEYIEFYGSDSENTREGKVFLKKITPSDISELNYSLLKDFNTETYPYVTTIVKRAGENISNYNLSKFILNDNLTPKIELSTYSITEDHSFTTNTGKDITLYNNGNYQLNWYVTGENDHSYLEPDNGTVAASESKIVNVTFDSRELPTQDTCFVIVFKSNDINNPNVDLTVCYEFASDNNRTPVIEDQTFNVDENSSPGTWIGAVVASDPDGDNLTYTLSGGTGQGTFAIDNLGNLSVSNNAELDYEKNTSLFVGVEVSDGTESAIATVTININDVFEIGDNNPPVIDDQTFNIDENSSEGTWIGAVVASDPDGDNLTYTITDGTGQGTFDIDNLGNLSVSNNSELDYEKNTSLNIKVEVNDGNASDNAIITVNINDINDIPTNNPPVIDDQTFNIDENSSNGTGVGSVIASDADGDDLIFSINGGTGENTFNIDNDGNLAVSDNTKLDFETNTSLSLNISVSDGNASDNALITININDVLEDTDGDGVTDDKDNCPNTPAGEAVDSDGCADSQKDGDNDGVTDDLDTCPDTPTGEAVDADGCADSQKDTDGDGVTDDLDTCPDTPAGEAVDASGCADSQNDTDGDGVTDDLDTCPDTPVGVSVDADGCPLPLFIESKTFISRIYPNPSDDKLIIELIDNYNIDKLEFIDFSGKIITPNKVEKNQNILDINVSNLIEGIYILEIVSDKEVNKIKILISR